MWIVELLKSRFGMDVRSSEIPVPPVNEIPDDAMIGKSLLVDFYDADPWNLGAQIHLVDHGPAGIQKLKQTDILDLFSECDQNFRKWKNNPGIKNPNHTKRTPLDLDLMDDDVMKDESLISHIVIRLSANDKKHPIEFNGEKVKNRNGNLVPVTIMQAAADLDKTQNGGTKKGEISVSEIFDCKGCQYVEFFIGRSDNHGIINFNIGLVYTDRQGRKTPIFIDPGNQNQKP